ncbi:hypothetical protein [Pseudarthrobacter raffinosi]|uniref:hypothetical protein n=1 Tax=Pseudarthrobacter raffinosi TaxID=2953651 RepID=UPI00208E08E1|nr:MULTISPECIES: hypothetical protein [unclassified Pseudarthrobacter]MCO4251310.1 hypothetical protein [Pseudarthrobacter sp. MDT3-9]MCO4264908.1 hypothetical protein [Pseudarthrobacter sp. MDT3-26]
MFGHTVLALEDEIELIDGIRMGDRRRPISPTVTAGSIQCDGGHHLGGARLLSDRRRDMAGFASSD